jgi:hypothetical protein
MSREFSQRSLIAQDLFDRDSTGFSAPCAPKAANEEPTDCCPQPELQLQLRQTRRTSISEDLWEDARRRHCDARQNWRSLLDRFVKPHH